MKAEELIVYRRTGEVRYLRAGEYFVDGEEIRSSCLAADEQVEIVERVAAESLSEVFRRALKVEELEKILHQFRGEAHHLKFENAVLKQRVQNLEAESKGDRSTKTHPGSTTPRSEDSRRCGG